MTEVFPAQWQETLTGEMLLLSLLGQIAYKFPDNKERGWFQSLIDEDVFAEAPFSAEREDVKAGLEVLQKWVEAGLSDATLKLMQVDYTSLFIGSADIIAPPWGSVYLSDSRLMFQEKTLEVRNWYRRFGLQSEKLYSEPDDHIGLELAFLAHLAKLGVQAIDEEDQEQFAALLDAQRNFMSEHILRWAPRFCEKVIAGAKTDLYRGMALLIRGALFDLAELLGLEITEFSK